MRRMITVVVMLSVLAMVPFFVSSVNAKGDVEYEDLRPPEESGESNFSGFAFDESTFSSSGEFTKRRAVENAKNFGRGFCKKLKAKGVEFSNLVIIEHPSHHWIFSTMIHAKCVFK